MRWSIKIAEVAGIKVLVHWTFFILLAWIAFGEAASGSNLAQSVAGFGFVLALFACIVLHELGHALTARHYGVRTLDITLLPIGGVARLERIPEQPSQEFWVAIAGPAVNVLIALTLAAVLAMTGESLQPAERSIGGGAFLVQLMWLNVALVLFNLLPAFPMDGGRVLRALLSTRMSRVAATHLAASIGQMMAIAFGMFGVLTGHWILLFIAMFVYIGAQAEAQAVEMRAIFKGIRVRDAMITQFHVLSPRDPMETAIQEWSLGFQRDFPVTDGGVAGMLFYQDIVRAIAEGRTNLHVCDVMRRECPLIKDSEPLDRAIDKMQSEGCGTLMVEHDGDLVGLLSNEHLGQWVMLHSSLQKCAAKAPTATSA